MTQAQVAQLLAALEAAFPSYGLEGGISLRQAYLDDDQWLCDANDPRHQQAYQQDTTDDWRKVSDDDLTAFFDAFSVFTYLDVRGWRYYLPAAMRHALLHEHASSGYWTYVSLLGNPEPRSVADLNARWAPQQVVDWLGWNAEQANFLARWLHFHHQQRLACEGWVDDNETESIATWMQVFGASA